MQIKIPHTSYSRRHTACSRAFKFCDFKFWSQMVDSTDIAQSSYVVIIWIVCMQDSSIVDAQIRPEKKIIIPAHHESPGTFCKRMLCRCVLKQHGPPSLDLDPAKWDITIPIHHDPSLDSDQSTDTAQSSYVPSLDRVYARLLHNGCSQTTREIFFGHTACRLGRSTRQCHVCLCVLRQHRVYAKLLHNRCSHMAREKKKKKSGTPPIA
ncbi:hypothetical protein EDD21DRAFT_214171 [Dissophora ornata]|nr:hypothetical protein EDD21DRAFT_214171 [Dissophora ornata]